MQNYQNPPYASPLARATLPRGTVLVVAPGARLVLGVILLLALSLRLWGLTFGLPYVIQPDEPSVEMRVLHMWYAADPNPHYYVYPSLYYDLQALLAFAVGHVAGLLQPDVLRHPLLHLPLFYLAGRAFTAILGTLTVLVVYLVGRMLDQRVGLIAALFLAVAAQHVQQSHYITVDAPAALFTALAALFALRALQRGDVRDVVLGGVAAGLAAGTKYNAAVALALPLAAALLSARAWSRRLLACALAIVACGVVFVLSTPFALLDPGPFLRSLRVVAWHYAQGHPGAEGNDNALWYLLYLGREGLQAPLTMLALAGLAVVVVRYRRAGLVLLAFALPYYALLCSTFVRFDRNVLPLLPFLALCAAVAAVALIQPLAVALHNRSAAYVLVLGIAAVPSANAATRSDFAITHRFSEEIAVAWANAHLPRGAALATENWEGRAFELAPKHYRITNLGTLALHPYGWFLARGIRYAVTDSYTDDAYLSAPRRYPVETTRYRELYRRARLLARITGEPLLRPGPTMSIYELR